MTDLLTTLGALTLGGSAAIAVLVFFSYTSRARYAARWRCWAWTLLCLRLAIPFSFLLQDQEKFHPLIQIPAPSDTVIYHTPATAPTTSESPQSEPSSPTAPGQSVSPPSTSQAVPFVPSEPVSPEGGSFSLSLSQTVTGLWIVGCAAAALWFLTTHLRFLSYLRRWSQPVSDPETIQTYNRLGDKLGLEHRPRLLVCTGLKAPMLAGLLHPVLLLPELPLSPEALRHSLLHELTHYRRRDIWLKVLALLANIVHWFNPLVWYMVRLVERDTELACDEDVLSHLSPDEHASYGRTILDAVAKLNG